MATRTVLVVRKGLGIWNLCPAPLYFLNYIVHLRVRVKANADMTPKKLRPRPSRRFATAFTRGQWQRKDHRKGAALAMPRGRAGAFTWHEQKSPVRGATQSSTGTSAAQRNASASGRVIQPAAPRRREKTPEPEKEGWLGGERESDHKASGRRNGRRPAQQRPPLRQPARRRVGFA